MEVSPVFEYDGRQPTVVKSIAHRPPISPVGTTYPSLIEHLLFWVGSAMGTPGCLSLRKVCLASSRLAWRNA